MTLTRPYPERDVLQDASARRAVVERLDDTLFFEAGAGSGKTSCLVNRFIALVEAGVPGDAIAAITFTEQGAAELADRIRQSLQEKAVTSERCRAALAVLDQAAICTLHAFAQRVLTEHPVEAGLPPRIEVLDEIASQVEFQRRWEAFLDRLIEDPQMERPLRLLLACDVKVEQLRDVARAFGDNWDLVPAVLAPSPDDESFIADVEAFCADVEAVCELRQRCVGADDKLLACLEDLLAYAGQLRAALDDEERLCLLHEPNVKFSKTYGQKNNWPNFDLGGLRDQIGQLDRQREAVADKVKQSCLERLAEALAGFTTEAAAERRAEGRLEFHDLLVLSRAVLRHPVHGVGIRTALARRYRRLLLDEFQDTDPIQLDLAVLIASDDPGAGEKHWADVKVKPGRLFFVGDPKQSIYRFRRADIGAFLDAREAFSPQPLQLTSNFRSAAPIMEWVNATFSTLIVEQARCQPAYLPLQARRPAPPSGPSVAFLGARQHDEADLKADDLRAREARSVAGALRQIVEQRWEVSEPGATGEEAWRPATWADICILLPARTSLDALERALDEVGVPYRVETSSLVYGTHEVRDLLAVARAVDDSTDELSLVTALRSPAFGCGDDDLYTWYVHHGGRWDHQRTIPDGVPTDHPVARAMVWIAEVARRRMWLSPSQVLELIVRDRRLLEVAFVHQRPRDAWRRLRFVVDQARAWEEAAGGSLRNYLTWVKLQSAESSRVVETVLPETDDQSVRIMTIHGAKGLEFPITLLSGMTTELHRRRSGVEVLFPPSGRWAIKLKKGVTTAEFDELRPIDEQMDAEERLRLLYVGATRARDHLVVSVHRKPRPARTAAELFWQHGNVDGLVQNIEEPHFEEAHEPRALPSPVRPLDQDRDSWEAERRRALEVGTRRSAISATAVAERWRHLAAPDPGLAKEARDLDLPPWQKGRYGSAIGRAVHAVLQTVDLVTGHELAEAAAGQAAAEGLLGREDVIQALAGSALASPVVKEAAGLPHWRELYVGAPVDGVVLEGYIDLVYRSPLGLVIVDYKTDAWRDETELEAKVAAYGVQLAAYSHAVEKVTGEAVVGTVLLFLSPSGAVERRTPGQDLDLPLSELVRATAGPMTAL